MPTKPARLCCKPGCRGVVRDGVCSACGPVKRCGWRSDKQRGNRHRRGYDNDWARLAKAFWEAAKRQAIDEGGRWPRCALCGEEVVEGQQHIDHKHGFDGLNDPRRLDWNELQVTHARCNVRKAGAKTR